METRSYDLSLELSKPSHKGVRFLRIEMAGAGFSPLALVWYELPDHSYREHGARIDLQKQVFLDDLNGISRELYEEEARAIVAFCANLSPFTECAHGSCCGYSG